LKAKGIRKLSTFLTADALLAAVHLVWGQLWLWPRQTDIQWTTGFGITWTFGAVLLALIALGYAVWYSLINKGDKSDETNDLSIGLFGASVIMGIINVGQSIASVMIKTICKCDVNSFVLVPIVDFSKMGFYGIVITIIFGSIVGSSIWGARKHYYGWANAIAYIFISILVLVAVRSLIAQSLTGQDGNYYCAFRFLTIVSFVSIGCIVAFLIHHWRKRRDLPQ